MRIGDLRLRGCDLRLSEEILCPSLRCFDARRFRAGGEGGNVVLSEQVGDALGDRLLGTDDDQSDVVALAKIDHATPFNSVFQRRADCSRRLCDGLAAGQGKEFAARGGVRHGIAQRVLSATAAEDETVDKVSFAFGNLVEKGRQKVHGARFVWLFLTQRLA